MKAYLILEDGTVFKGQSVGSTKEAISEIVFNTSMTGYLEVLSDPSYAGQAVVMTYPLIGNYGITPDMESNKAWPDGYIIKEISRLPSNFRSWGGLNEFLIRQDIPGICKIDTRALTKLLREKGTMNGMITTDEAFKTEEVLQRIKAYRTKDAVARVTCKSRFIADDEDFKSWTPSEKEADIGNKCVNSSGIGKGSKKKFRVALMDFGAKRNIIRSLQNRGCEVVVFPAFASANEIIGNKPDGIMLSNGPGDPEDNKSIIKEIKTLYETTIPIFGICLGHQLMALAMGGKTYKLKYGHRGGNHPVKELVTGRVYISSQNHGYAVEAGSIDESIGKEAFVNVNDGTNEGFIYARKGVFTVQFHPEACPGPTDTAFLFDRFIDSMKT
ncbi:MAG: carbamoyl phosphate synthase small subunit [Lachnospiraceae bacterium]|jgi:carbamoyl-phosphate synthase small subunit|nr:carbamoyl phosphate synthase small subunit [Lachnospiraceae bacterium]